MFYLTFAWTTRKKILVYELKMLFSEASFLLDDMDLVCHLSCGHRCFRQLHYVSSRCHDSYLDNCLTSVQASKVILLLAANCLLNIMHASPAFIAHVLDLWNIVLTISSVFFYFVFVCYDVSCYNVAMSSVAWWHHCLTGGSHRVWSSLGRGLTAANLPPANGERHLRICVIWWLSEAALTTAPDLPF